ncbi:MAG: rod-binding protein [Spirochaetales bacterium]|nr:rod-binding protein [Spirochaetales bacterium]
MEILSSGAYLPDPSVGRAREAAAAAARSSTTAAASRGSVGARRGVDRSSKLYQVSLEFEAILIKQMLNAMRKSVAKSGMLDGGMAEEFFEDMLYDEYAKKMAQTAQFGLADLIVRQLSTES